MGCAFAALIVLAAIASSTAVSLIARSPHRALAIAAVTAAIAAAIVAVFSVAIRRTARVFREQERQRRQLLADVAHELRTPLAILQGRLEGLLDGVYARDDARLSELLEETRHLSRLVEDLRTIANAEAGALDLRKELVDVAELVRETADSFDRPITVEIEGALPAVKVDPVRIREVLLNLLSNADRHTPKDGAITIRAQAGAKGVVIRVIDTGAGIPESELPGVFERFHKGAGSRGSGLGLAIARDLARAHGGDVILESAVGRGTTVTVSLPA
ncbi:MAG: sensor histidine kinase [Acidobacteriota bacterium]